MARQVRRWTGLAGMAGACLIAGVAQAREPSAHERAIAGQWELARDGQNRSCGVTLRDQPEGTDLALGMPPGCRRALPVLASANLWQSEASSRVVLAAASGEPILEFRAVGAGTFAATGPAGEGYRLTPTQDHIKAALVAPVRTASPDRLPGFQSLRSRDGVEPAPVAVAQAQTQAQPRRSPQPGPESTQIRVDAKEVPGRYAFLREEGRDTGCLVTLQTGGRAQLAPACRDQGILIFDPVRWAFERGQIVLTARRGHNLRLSPQPNGHWDKSPADGTAFSFRKI